MYTFNSVRIESNEVDLHISFIWQSLYTLPFPEGKDFQFIIHYPLCQLFQELNIIPLLLFLEQSQVFAAAWLQIVKLPLNPARIVFLSNNRVGYELNISSFLINSGLSACISGIIFAIARPM